jgi:hypothetical protein
MSIFRNTFSDTIKTQLSKRQDAMVDRTMNNISYLTTRNAWVRMSSSVNVKGSNSLARSYILQGGTLNTLSISGSLFSSQKQGLGTGFQNAYATQDQGGTKHSLGIRPMPGITNIEVKSKSAYGSLREVIVNFQCWSENQLEDLELLYMRPGYTVLLEWGWLPYLDNTGALINQIKDPYYDIINKGATDRTTIFTDLYKRSKDSDGNYEALFGYVKNYQWSARQDGGYDCQTTVISTGEIIESLKINYIRKDTANLGVTVSGNTSNPGLLTDEFEFKTTPINDAQKTIYDTLPSHYQKNILAGMWAELYYKIKDPNTTIKKNALLYNNDTFLQQLSLAVNASDSIEPGSSYHVYISLRSCLSLLQKYAVAQSGEPLIKLSTYSSNITDDGKSLLCIAHPLQVSVDPSVCVIKSPYWYSDKGLLQTTMASVNQVALVNGGKIVLDIARFLLGSTTLGNSHVAGDPAKIDGLLAVLKSIPDLDTFTAVEAAMSTNPTIANLKYTSMAALINAEFGFGNGVAIDYKTRIKPLEDSLRNIGLTVVFNHPTYSTTSTSQAGSSTSIREDFTTGTITNPSPGAVGIVASGQAGTALNVLENLDKIPLDYFEDGKGDSELGIIGNIYINVDFLYRSALDNGLENSDHKGKNEINLYNYLKKIINNVQSSLGNLNTFEIHVDPIDGDIARIIDINYTEKDRRKKSSLFELKVHTLDSIVRSYSLQSQIFPNQSAVIAIGAQTKKNSNGQIGMQSNTLMDFNIGLEDRIMPSKTAPKDIAINNSSPKVGGNIAAIIKLFSSISPSNTVNVRDLFNTGKNNLRDLITYFQNICKSSSSNRNIIPTKFSFEMDGIGGLVIGNLFTISDEVLPKGYKGNGLGSTLAQTVTGIGHTISDGDWKTKIDALTFILDEPSGNKRFNELDLKTIITDALAAYSTLVSVNMATGGGAPPSAGIYNPSAGGGNIISSAGTVKIFGTRKLADIRQIILHNTNGYGEGQATFEYNKNQTENGAHYYVGRSGVVVPGTQGDLTQITRHANLANPTSVGIEICNIDWLKPATPIGGKPRYKDFYGTVETEEQRRKLNEGYGGVAYDLGYSFYGNRYYEDYTDAQMNALKSILKDIIKQCPNVLNNGKLNYNYNEVTVLQTVFGLQLNNQRPVSGKDYTPMRFVGGAKGGHMQGIYIHATCNLLPGQDEHNDTHPSPKLIKMLLDLKKELNV